MSKVAGRLANFIDNWLEITHDVVILNAISGYQIPFLQTPPSRPFLQEPRLSEVEERLCALEIGRLLAKGAIQHAAFAPDQYLSSYFLIDKTSEGALPFGLSSAPYIFTKLLKPLATVLREKGFLSVIYLDEFLLIGDTLQECRRNVEETLRLLNSLGFVTNLQKCELSPSQERKFLGFTLNSSRMLPEGKRLAILKRLKSYSVKQSCKIRDFASLIGSLNSICRTVAYGPIYIRNFERQKFLVCVDSKDNYDAQMRLCSELQPDFQWWIRKLQSPLISRSLIKRSFTYEIFSDASSTGWGASIGKRRTHGWWSPQEENEHINFLELKAVEYALKSFMSERRSLDLLLRIDNTTAIAYINKGGSSRFPKLSSLAKSIWQWCESRDIYLFASYISSADNVVANAESRISSTETEWEITPKFFSELIYLEPNSRLLTSPFRNQHPFWQTISLVAGRLSGKHFGGKAFQKNQ